MVAAFPFKLIHRYFHFILLKQERKIAIGDYENLGVTPQQFRPAKRFFWVISLRVCPSSRRGPSGTGSQRGISGSLWAAAPPTTLPALASQYYFKIKVSCFLPRVTIGGGRGRAAGVRSLRCCASFSCVMSWHLSLSCPTQRLRVRQNALWQAVMLFPFAHGRTYIWGAKNHRTGRFPSYFCLEEIAPRIPLPSFYSVT